jgi:5-methylcytosine-specific restriction endonuclease McrA
MSNWEAHHKEFRRHSGHDSNENLITLCTTCHAQMHPFKELDATDDGN